MKLFGIFILLSLGHIIASGQSFPKDINPDKVYSLIQFCDSSKADEIMIIYKGKTIVHWNNPLCDTVYMNTRSMVKSWTGLVIGILIDKQMIKSIDEPVCSYLPEWKGGCENKVTIKNLLQMTGGLYRRSGKGALVEPDINTYLMNLKPDTLPDIQFNYSNESVQLLGMIIEKATGKDAEEIFRELLFQPLSMDSSSLARDSAGNAVVFGGCKTTVQDAAQVALLMRNMGKYKGEQIISEDWIKASYTPGELSPFYGYLWWIDNNSKNKNYAATGDLGQMTIIFPDLDLIFLRRQNCDLSPASVNMSWMGPVFLQRIADIVNNPDN